MVTGTEVSAVCRERIGSYTHAGEDRNVNLALSDLSSSLSSSLLKRRHCSIVDASTFFPLLVPICPSTEEPTLFPIKGTKYYAGSSDKLLDSCK